MGTANQSAIPVASEAIELSLLDKIAEETARVGARYMPTLTVKQFSQRETLLRELKEMLVENTDYGIIPGTVKPTLLLPGAQKLCTFFGYVPHYEARQIEDWTGTDHSGEALFYYDFTCVLLKDGKPVGEGRGSCNSWETKYRYRWVTEELARKRADFGALPTRGGRISEPAFAVDKAETGGKYGKPAEHWQAFRAAIANGTAVKVQKEKRGGGMMDAWEIDATLYRIPNDGFADVINTCQKMGQKRAYIAATLSATGASQYFTQDTEDSALDHAQDARTEGIDTGGHPVGTQAAANHVRDQKIAEHKGSAPQQAAPPVATAAPQGSGIPEVDELWKQLGNRAKNQEVMDKLRAELWTLVGDNADTQIAEIVRTYGDPLSKMTFARRTVLEVWKHIKELKDVVTEPEPPEAAQQETMFDQRKALTYAD